MTIDQYNDPAFGTLIKQLDRMPNLEATVKTASVDSAEAKNLPDSAFAWASERKFPIHTPEHAALSYAYFKCASERMPPEVEQELNKALAVYGIEPKTFEVKTAAAAEPEYLLPDLKLLPVKTAADVEYAQRKLVEALPRLDLEHRATACANLVKHAEALSVTLHPEVQKLAGFVVSSTRVAAEWLDARASVATDTTHQQAYTKLAAELRKGPEELADRGGLLKLANAIGELDVKAGLEKHYDRRLPDALRTVFNTEKLAAGSLNIAGAMIPVTKLASLPVSFWQDLGGDELSREIAPNGSVDSEKLATVVETLPLDLKTIIRKQLRA